MLAYAVRMALLSLHKSFVPTTGPFRRGSFTNGKIEISERRWLAAIICWMIGVTAIAGMLLSMAFPKGQYALDKDQIAMMPMIAIVFGIVGGIIAMWSRRIEIDVERKEARVSRGFSLLRISKSAVFENVWLEVHPITTLVKAISWSGFALVLHLGSEEGVVLAAEVSDADARAFAKEWAGRTSIELRETAIEEAGLIEAVG